MNPQDFNHLEDLLTRLNKSHGHFIFEDGEHYCQFIKERGAKTIRFEAQSNHFNPSLNKLLSRDFKKLGFGLKKEENYAKDVILNSKADVTNMAKEVETIFEQIYRVGVDVKFESDDQIEATSPVQKQAPHTSISSQPSSRQGNKKLIGNLVVLLAVGLFVYYIGFYDTEQKKEHSNNFSFATEAYQPTSKSYLLLSLDEFKRNFNAIAGELDFGYRIGKIKIEKGVNHSFKYCFPQNLCIVGGIDSEDNSLFGVYLLREGDGVIQSGANTLVATAVLISAIDPTLTAEDRRQITTDLGLWEDRDEPYAFSNTIVRNGVKYSISSSPQTGFLFGIEVP